ncbi:MAG: extracellular solute-binding protein [Armatimonadetes bacterium]|nr:extracellular solute-binding protein [Anaerolineae bacterium]
MAVVGITSAQTAPVELRLMWYNDGTEGEALRAVLDDFEAANPGIKVIVDTVAFADLATTLQAQVEAGTPPDMARLVDVARFAGSYLDLRPLVADAEYWDTNFPPAVLGSMRSGEDDNGLYGYPTQFTVSGPYINRTLFELAGVEVPSDVKEDVTWEEWEAAAVEVAEKTGTPYAVALDRSGHRFWTFSMSQGAEYLDADGVFTVDTPGFRSAAERLVRWHESGIMPPEIWGGAAGTFTGANEFFVNAQVVFYVSGSWQVAQFDTNIGDNFEWSAVPNPVDSAGKCMMPGGAITVAFADTAYPEEVALVMDYLASEPVLEKFSAESLFLPGQLALAEKGIEYPKQNENLNIFLAEIPSICDQAYDLQYSPYTFVLNPAIRDRLTQVITGELTLDDAIVAVQTAIDEAVAAAPAQ